MLSPYKTVHGAGSDSFIEKRSKFIGYAKPGHQRIGCTLVLLVQVVEVAPLRLALEFDTQMAGCNYRFSLILQCIRRTTFLYREIHLQLFVGRQQGLCRNGHAAKYSRHPYFQSFSIHDLYLSVYFIH